MDEDDDDEGDEDGDDGAMDGGLESDLERFRCFPGEGLYWRLAPCALVKDTSLPLLPQPRVTAVTRLRLLPCMGELA